MLSRARTCAESAEFYYCTSPQERSAPDAIHAGPSRPYAPPEYPSCTSGQLRAAPISTHVCLPVFPHVAYVRQGHVDIPDGAEYVVYSAAPHGERYLMLLAAVHQLAGVQAVPGGEPGYALYGRISVRYDADAAAGGRLVQRSRGRRWSLSWS